MAGQQPEQPAVGPDAVATELALQRWQIDAVTAAAARLETIVEGLREELAKERTRPVLPGQLPDSVRRGAEWVDAERGQVMRRLRARRR